MNRRELLASVGMLGTTGCLRLQGETTSTPEADGETTATTAAAVGTDAADTDGSPAAERLTLSETWAAEFGVRHILTDDGHFFFNGANVVGEAVPGGGVLWTDEVEYEGSTVNLGADAIARGGGVVVFGFFSEPGTVENPGTHFVAYDDATEERAWSVTVPSDELDGDFVLPGGAVVVDGVAVLGVNPAGPASVVYGVDAATGEQLWRMESDRTLRYLDAHGGEAYLGQGDLVRVDPKTGAVNGREQSRGGSPGLIHGNSLFVGARSSVDAVPLSDGGTAWTASEIGETTVLAVDNSLVVAGTVSGGVHALDRATGERRWKTTIDGTIWKIEQTAEHVWVADRETGLTAYEREAGRNVHRSTQPIERSDVGVVSGTMLFGADTARAYDIVAE
jgi:outer membrane protein assembly factor BamB